MVKTVKYTKINFFIIIFIIYYILFKMSKSGSEHIHPNALIEGYTYSFNYFGGVHIATFTGYLPGSLQMLFFNVHSIDGVIKRINKRFDNYELVNAQIKEIN